jgi:hypothetical protein
MSQQILATLAAIMAVGVRFPKVGGSVECMELEGNCATVDVVIDDIHYTIEITENGTQRKDDAS